MQIIVIIPLPFLLHFLLPSYPALIVCCLPACLPAILPGGSFGLAMRNDVYYEDYNPLIPASGWVAVVALALSIHPSCTFNAQESSGISVVNLRLLNQDIFHLFFSSVSHAHLLDM